MDKYKQHFLKNIRKKLEEWESMPFIPHDEVYRLVHSIAGTASIIGLDEIGQNARKLLDMLNEEENKTWTIEEVKQYIFQLVKSCYEYEESASTTFPSELYTQGEEPVILLIDDDTSFLMYMKEKLEKIGWYVVAIANPQKAITSFYDVRPDCVVIDIHMKEANGFEVLGFLKEKLKQQFIPTIMVSVDNSKVVRIKSYEMGADDFIQKPFDLDEFIARVKRQLERKRHIDEVLLVDELTHVYNRKYLKQAYALMQNEWKRLGEPFCLAILDLDHFKQVNDRYGHLVGDIVLRKFAELLRQGTRMSDIVVRFGGEEFVILFSKTKIQEAYEVANRLREQFERYPFQEEGATFSCTFSCGVVEVTDGDAPFEHWLRLADSALYEAKQKGRNRVVSAVPSQGTVQQKTIKIAVVDDDPIMRTIITDIVMKLPCERKAKHEVQTFKDGVEFIDSNWHQDLSPCLVILDGVMPKMDGLEVLQWIRMQKRSDRYKVIMLTSRRSENDIARALELGADDYITKPFKLLELEARICQMMKRMR
ncbi:GGDEF domain-containing response regulator [Anoxybacteroides amylolyticum]|uniref:Diguanylate cyclase domain protein n=1 Tax=Anoxybacteroides amylolyticum TaxID=294699 RepID=A0A167TQU1_9BACL|nr:diguanylate cyclase [Anoxybacillus amylolyticus]ANB61920.1 diguanylate cyclase domain protein [Anoxybacillus amylolyticus]